MFYDNDVKEFFNDFAENVNYKTFVLKGIYDNNYAESNVYLTSVSGSTTSLTLKSSDVVLYAILEDTNITVRSILYRIKTIKDDKTGISILELEEV